MKKIHSIPVIFILFTSALLFIWSCSQDIPVTAPPPEPYQFDSARFEYDVIRLEGDSYTSGGLWSMDTNQIFIINLLYQTFVRIMDMHATYYTDPNFVPSTISGISNNEVYLSGLLIKEGQPGIKKWNGSYLEEFPIDLTFNRTTFINKSLIRSSSDMWLLCNNIIIRKQGSDFTTYELQDTISKILFAFYDDAGIPSYAQLFLNMNIDSLQTIMIYKFYGTWQKVFESREPYHFVYSEFSNNVCKRDISNVYLFNGSGFENFFSTDIIDLLLVQGFDGNNFMINSFNSNGISIFHWNGQKFSQEKFVLGTGTNIFPINENLYYFYYENFGLSYTEIVRAVRKK